MGDSSNDMFKRPVPGAEPRERILVVPMSAESDSRYETWHYSDIDPVADGD
ncbi:MAG: hypothetical protein RR244_00585 [Oscillospiraceae bacterium]